MSAESDDARRSTGERLSPAHDHPLVPGLVSVILVNYKGADNTIACLRSLEQLDWPSARLEVICVDNASGDGSLERIQRAAPQAKVVDSGSNLGFAGGCNYGVELARGEYVGFINNDARPDLRWVAEAVRELEADRTVASVACKVLDWDGMAVDFVDAAMTWFGMGYKPHGEKPDTGEHETPRDVLFGTGSAVFFRVDVFRQVGGFDERFFMFFEDVDLGWRLNLLGHRVRYVPSSVAFHRHHATIERFGQFRERYLLERNALLSMFKNFEEEALLRCLPPAMALAVRRSIAATDVDPRMLDLQVRPGNDAELTVEVPKDALTSTLAIDYLVEQLPSLVESRTEIQRRRRRSDRELFPLFRKPLEPAYAYPGYVAAHDLLVSAFGLDRYFQRGRRILVVTGEPLGARMAGPAIRAYEMSRLLSREHQVTLATLGACDVDGDGFDTLAANGKMLRRLLEHTDVLVFQGLLLSTYPWICDSPAAIVADIYDPFHLETLEQERHRPMPERLAVSQGTVDALNVQLARADYLLCASEKQRAFWLGQLAGQGRVNPLTYDDDESLRSLIDVAPFGLPDQAPRQTASAIRGRIPGIGGDDKVVLWGGGVYNWFDPLTLISAIDRARVEVPNVRLVFMGMKHPNPGVPDMQMATRARELAASLGLTGRHVFFNESWVSYEERANFLLDADIGVSCHFEHVETEFSFRTRILDYLWAGVPIVCTAGDSFGDLVTEECLGIAVPPQNIAALSRALVRLLQDEALALQTSSKVRAIAPDYTWSTSLEPLVRFARSPRRAPDLFERLGRPAAVGPPALKRKAVDIKEDVALAKEYLREGGVKEVGRRATGRLRRVARRQ
ncbi:MAG: glycosyltransferase [Dermatophilaceae bacterium]